MDAVVVKKNSYQVVVTCPYCSAKHKHGLMGRDSISGQYRSSDCHKGDYRVVEKKAGK